MKKGDIVTIAMQGDYGKPRPAVVFQSEKLVTDSILLIPFTTYLVKESKIRILIEPTKNNGLQKTSQTMTEKITAIKKDKVSEVIGRLEPDEVQKIEQALLLILDI